MDRRARPQIIHIRGTCMKSELLAESDVEFPGGTGGSGGLGRTRGGRGGTGEGPTVNFYDFSNTVVTDNSRCVPQYPSPQLTT